MDKLGKAGYNQGDMSAKTMDFQKPEGCYSQKYDQSPTMYVERQNKMQEKEGAKLRKESYKGRY